MKDFKNILILSAILAFAVSCNEGIDPISYVAPGPDQAAPVVNIKYPVEGTRIQVPELIGSVNIQMEVTDDIELKSVLVKIDGAQITSYSDFKDYRRLVTEYLYTNLTNGSHTLTVTATDIENKSTTGTVHFEKKPPYTPLYDGETFFMPFDGDYVEKITFATATVVGTPGFAGEALKGLNSYKGATDSYLTFPTTGLTGPEFSAAFWYKVNATPDRSGILNASPSGEDRTKGFRLFREGSASSQRIKLNVGTGSGETWNDGDVIAAPATDWVHIAFTVSSTSCIIYINGAVARSVSNTGLDWTGCNVIGIGSGAPNFIYWNHKSDLSFYDELRLFNKALSQTEIQTIMDNDKPYVPKYSGEVIYMPFEGNYKEMVSKTEASKVGTPGFDDAGKVGKAYAGAASSYLTFPLTSLSGSGSMSAVFWYKVNASPDRSGIINSSLTGEDRTKGFRLFREGSATSQRIKINVGTGTGETWNDGGLIDVTLGQWVHVAYTISDSHCIIYLNGEVAADVATTGINWTGCTTFSIGSGEPNFTYWGHGADLSLYDELRMFNKALTQNEIQTIIANEN
ncbi:MAG: LamG domain-containing protein [Bacteroidales bacterium]|nr:LamG domain-containing protein [Bacteroidales bacterium]